MRKSKLFAKSPIICEPREDMNRALYIVGWISRALVHFACVFGSSLFIADSFGITSPSVAGMPKASVLILALSCLLVSACTSAAAYNRKMLAIVPPASLAAFFLLLFAWGNPVTLIENGVRCVWNTALGRMAEAGYYSFSNLALSNAYSYDPSLCLNIGMAIVAIVFGVIFGLCLIRKGKLLPTAIVCVVILVPVFTYNLTRTNSGMTAAVVFIVSALAMSLYDRRYSGREFAFISKRDRKLAKKAAKEKAKKEKRAVKAQLKRRAKFAYDSALAMSDDRKIAKAAKRAVYSLVAEEKRNAKEALKLEKKTEKREAKKAKKSRRAELKKQKKENAVLARKNRERAKKDKAFAKQLADEKKTVAQAKAKEKKARLGAKRLAEHEVNEKKRYNIAAGGFAGLCAVVCALIAVWLPASIVSGNFPEIPVINEPMSTARAYVSAYLSGDDVDLNDLNMYGNLSELAPRTLSFDPLEFEGVQIFAVNGDGQYPVYLKSWMGRDFDEKTGTWLGADSDQVVDYRSQFGKNFTPDSLKTELYSMLFQTSTQMYSKNAYMVFEKYGFAVEHINVRRINSASKIVFIPSTMNTNYAIMGHNTLDPISSKYSYFYDGIYSSRFFDIEVPYSTASFVTTMKHPQITQGIYGQQRYFELALDYIEIVDKCEETLHYSSGVDGYIDIDTEYGKFSVSEGDLSAVNNSFIETVERENVNVAADSLVDKYIHMTDGEREEFREYLDTENNYAEFAAGAYGTAFGGDKIKELADQILADNGYHAVYNRLGDLTGYADENSETVSEHEVVMGVINYLRDNYTYTITPKSPETLTDSVLNTFLFDTKEGYCTHFATAAAALIRSYGFPVRFCEGYIATDFSRDFSENAPSKYITYVLDEDAHAWIEVYLDTVGWTQYETTPEYGEIIYDSDYEFVDEAPIIEDDPNAPQYVPSTPEPEPEPEAPELLGPNGEEEPEVDYVRIAIIVGIVIAVIAAVYAVGRLVWYFLKLKAKEANDKRLAVVHEALADERRLKTPDANRELALELNDLITLCLKIARLEPEDGEGCVEFSERLEEFYGGLCEASMYEIVSDMLKAEFGTEISAAELYVIADFAERFASSVYGGLSPFEKLYWRYIKRLI